MPKTPIALLGALLVSGSAMAQNITAADTSEILNIARGFGSATLESNEQGEPMISGRMDGASYRLFFYGCEKTTHCESIQFYAGWEMDSPVSTRDINEWNRTKRYGRAYIDSSNDPVVEMDVTLEHGVSRRNLEENFSLWKTVMGGFKSAISK